MALVLVGATSLAGLELLCRLFDPQGISYYPETARYFDTLVLEEPIGYRNRPGLEGRYYGAPVRINSLGLRDREIPPEPGPHEFRILVLGDSFPFGIGVEYEKSIPAQLEQLLNSHGGEAIRYRTVNMGVPSYNTEQELYQLKSLGMNLHPKLVILMFAVNDIEPKMWVLEKRRSWYVNVIQRSYALSLAAVAYRDLAGRFAPSRMSIAKDHYQKDHPRWLAIDRSLTEINALCRSAGIRFVVVAAEDTRPVDMVADVGAREGFPVIKLLPFRGWEERDQRRYVNSRVDSHPNVEGSRIYASLLFEELARLGVLEEATPHGTPEGSAGTRR